MNNGPLRQMGPYLLLGGTFAGSMVIGVLLGHWLDTEAQTSPWGVLGGSLLGMGSGFYHFFKVVLAKPKTKTLDETGESPEDDEQDGDR